MLDKLKELFTQEVSSENIVLLLILIGVGLLAIFFFYILVKACFMVEKQSGRPAHNIIKTAIIAAVPSVYFTLAMFIPSVEEFPVKYVIIAGIIGLVIVALWNFITFGPIGGIMFSLMHIVFGALASLGIISLIFIGIVLIIMFFFGGSLSGSSATSGGSFPSEVTDINNGLNYHVIQGANGEYYVNDNGRYSLLRNSDYSGRYLDNDGNTYRASYD